MTRVPIQSSHIKSIGHANNTLEVEFHNGHVYQYQNVTRHTYDRITSHPSAGHAFHALVATRNKGLKL